MPQLIRFEKAEDPEVCVATVERVQCCHLAAMLCLLLGADAGSHASIIQNKRSQQFCHFALCALRELAKALGGCLFTHRPCSCVRWCLVAVRASAMAVFRRPLPLRVPFISNAICVLVIGNVLTCTCPAGVGPVPARVARDHSMERQPARQPHHPSSQEKTPRAPAAPNHLDRGGNGLCRRCCGCWRCEHER